MIQPALLGKHLRDARLVLIPGAALLFLFGWANVFMQGQVDMRLFQSLLDKVPDFVEKLSPVPFAQLTSYPARISLAWEHPVAYLLMAFWCVARSSDVVAGELGRGTLELLLAQPVRRLEVLATSTLVTLAGIILLSGSLWLGTAGGIATCSVKQARFVWRPLATPQSAGGDAWHRVEKPDERMYKFTKAREYVPPSLNYIALGVFLCGLTTLISTLENQRWRVIGIVTGFYVVQMVMELLGQAVNDLHWLRRLTFLQAYEPIQFVSRSFVNPGVAWCWFQRNSAGEIVELGPLTANLLLVACGSVAFMASTYVFQRRDLPAPL